MCQYQQFHPCSDVHILSAVCHGTSNAEILVVEEIHDNSSTGSVLVDSWPYLSCHVCELWFPRRLWLCSSSLWFLPHPPVLPLLLHDLHEESQGKEGRDQWQPLQWKDPQNGDWKWQHQAKEIKLKSWSSILSLENIFLQIFLFHLWKKDIFQLLTCN